VDAIEIDLDPSVRGELHAGLSHHVFVEAHLRDLMIRHVLVNPHVYARNLDQMVCAENLRMDDALLISRDALLASNY
jgi:hypothetical protein